MPEQSQFQDLIRRVRDRDEAAAAELVKRYESAIRRVIRINLRDARMRRVLDSMDICQSVLASFFVRTALGQYELESPEQLLNLLVTIARNKLTNKTRAAGRSARLSPRGGRRGTAGLLDPASDPSEQASAREILEKVRAGLNEDERYLAEQSRPGPRLEGAGRGAGRHAGSRPQEAHPRLDRVMADLGLDEVAMNEQRDPERRSVLDRQKHAWDRRRLPIEEFLKEACLHNNADALLDLIYNEIVLARGAGRRSPT